MTQYTNIIHQTFCEDPEIIRRCNRKHSGPEKAAAMVFREFKLTFLCEVPVVGVSVKRSDFCITTSKTGSPYYLLEIDGPGHFRQTKGWNMDRSQNGDRLKTYSAMTNGTKMIRIHCFDMNIDEMIDHIKSHLRIALLMMATHDIYVSDLNLYSYLQLDSDKYKVGTLDTYIQETNRSIALRRERIQEANRSSPSYISPNPTVFALDTPPRSQIMRESDKPVTPEPISMKNEYYNRHSIYKYHNSQFIMHNDIRNDSDEEYYNGRSSSSQCGRDTSNEGGSIWGSVNMILGGAILIGLAFLSR